MGNEPSKTDTFIKLFKAHDIIADISKLIGELRNSIPAIVQTGEGQSRTIKTDEILDEIRRLETVAFELLKKRAEFDIFFYTLPLEYQEVLRLRCESCLQWKEVASHLNFSAAYVRRIFGKICGEAEKAGLINTDEH